MMKHLGRLTAVTIATAAFGISAVAQNKLFVGDLSFDTNNTNLQDLFGAAGNVTNVDLITHRATGKPRGFGFNTQAGGDPNLTATSAQVHLIGDLNLTDTGVSAAACGKLAGLGNADVTIILTGTATVQSTCVNPAGSVAPGQANQVVTGSINIRSSEIKNGTVSFCVRTADPACTTAKSCGCPGNNWTATIQDVEFDGLMLTVEQNGKVVLQETALE